MSASHKELTEDVNSLTYSMCIKASVNSSKNKYGQVLSQHNKAKADDSEKPANKQRRTGFNLNFQSRPFRRGRTTTHCPTIFSTETNKRTHRKNKTIIAKVLLLLRTIHPSPRC